MANSSRGRRRISACCQRLSNSSCPAERMPRVSSVDLECGGETRADARSSEAPLGNAKTLLALRLEEPRRHGLVIVVDHDVNLRPVQIGIASCRERACHYV